LLLVCLSNIEQLQF